MSTLAERLLEVCGDRVLPAHLAKECDVSRPAAGKWFEGGDMKAENVFCVADFLKIEPRWLATGKGPKTAPERDPQFKRLIELWPRLTEATRGELIGLAAGRAPPEDRAASPEVA